MKRKVGYLGPEGTFTHQAAMSIEPDSVLLPLPSSLAVIQEIESGNLDAGVIPIDNSIEGPVVPSIDALLAYEVKITGMVEVPIEFTAFRARKSCSYPGTVIVSHPHALAQCQEYIARMGLPTRTAASTAAASAHIELGEIALSADVCQEIYEVEPIERKIQDSLNGVTRFVRIESVGTDANPESDATVVAIIPEGNRAGVLARITGTFSEYGLDLQGLVLRPLETVDFRYVFVFTVMASPFHPDLLRCLVSLTDASDGVIVLGSFKSMPSRKSSVGTRQMRPLASNSDELAQQLSPSIRR